MCIDVPQLATLPPPPGTGESPIPWKGFSLLVIWDTGQVSRLMNVWRLGGGMRCVISPPPIWAPKI